MKKIAEQHLGKNYDYFFEWSDTRMYCSELVWKIYYEALGVEIGKLERMGDFDLGDEIVRRKLEERFGSNIPYDEKVISPGEMFKSRKLKLVYRN